MSSCAVAVFGLSGVGKSTLIQQAVTEIADHVHVVNAGELIRRGRKLTEVRQLPSKAILENQAILAKEFEKEASRDTGIVVLDGHCIVDTDTDVIGVPTSVIQRLSLSAIVLVVEPVEVIARRRELDDRRVRPMRSLEELRSHQDLARHMCKSYQEHLGIPVIELSSRDVSQLTMVLKRLTPRGR